MTDASPIALASRLWTRLRTSHGTAEKIPTLFEACMSTHDDPTWADLFGEAVFEDVASDAAAALVPHVASILHTLPVISANASLALLEAALCRPRFWAPEVEGPLHTAIVQFRAALPTTRPALEAQMVAAAPHLRRDSERLLEQITRILAAPAEPIALGSSVWSGLATSYAGPSDVPGMVQACLAGATDESWWDLVNEVCHQGEASQAVYAVVPHLLPRFDSLGAEALQATVQLLHCAFAKDRRVPTDVADAFAISIAQLKERMPEVLEQIGSHVAGIEPAQARAQFEQGLASVIPSYVVSTPVSTLTARAQGIVADVLRAGAWSVVNEYGSTMVRITFPDGATRTSALTREEIEAVAVECGIAPIPAA